MPIFEYQCKQCGHVTEFLEEAGSKKSHPCEECGSRATKRIFSTFGVEVGASSSSDVSSCPTGTCSLT